MFKQRILPFTIALALSLVLFAAPAQAESVTCGGLPAGGLVPAGTYEFAPGCAHTLSGTLIIDGAAVTINGGGGAIQGGGAFRLFAVDPDGSLALNNVTLTGGRSAAYSGGAILNDHGVVTITDSAFVGNAAHFGGAVFNDHGAVTITNSFFTGNFADKGGAVFSYGGGSTVTVTGSAFLGNAAGDSGGAIHNDARSTVIVGEYSIVRDNTAGGDGDGVYTSQNAGMTSVLHSLVYDEMYAQSGGSAAVYAEDNWWGRAAGPGALTIGFTVDTWLDTPSACAIDSAAGSLRRCKAPAFGSTRHFSVEFTP
ncbi:MAG: hypothetical protein JXB47_14815 [Anaerolineae bacterium]|nr:hypothetical protein [Anaerolineae bacterium]